MNRVVFLIIILVLVFLLRGIVFSHGDLPLPPSPPPEFYGDVLINKRSLGKDNSMAPVVFSHWLHRVKYRCNVCHVEIGFSMKSNETDIECERMFNKGEYCGACHNGRIAFGRTETEGKKCDLCHNSMSASNIDRFNTFKDKMPRSNFGNEVDWAKALTNNLISPKYDLSGNGHRSMSVDKTLILKAEMSGIPSAVFPHGVHEEWLDCSNCHPDIFNIKKKTTMTLTMQNILKGEACGLCHLRVAFPLNDCKRCHPGIRR